MSTDLSPAEAKTIPVYFPIDAVETIEKAEKDLADSGLTRNALIVQATQKGMPLVVANALKNPGQKPFIDMVREVVSEIDTKTDITTKLVLEKLFVAFPDMDGDEKDRAGMHLSQAMTRLRDQGILRETKRDGQRRVWRRMAPKKKTAKSTTS